MSSKLPLPELATRLALRPKEAAAVLGISERKLRQSLGRIPHVRLDGVLLFPVETLRAWLADQAHTSAGNAADALAKRVLEGLRK